MPALSDAEWQAKDDARTLAEAEEIKMDKERLERAKVAANKILEEKKEEAKAMAKVARKSSTKNGGGKRASPRNKKNQKAPSTGMNVFGRI
jgi:hypothetical protein